jgi:hypothetical protein
MPLDWRQFFLPSRMRIPFYEYCPSNRLSEICDSDTKKKQISHLLFEMTVRAGSSAATIVQRFLQVKHKHWRGFLVIFAETPQ